MKKIIIFFSLILTTVITQAQELRGVTFGFGAGIGSSGGKQYDYFLDPANNSLQKQALGKSSLVISSMVSIKLSNLSVQKQGPQNNLKNTMVRTGVQVPESRKETIFTRGDEPPLQKAKWYERLVVNLALNLAEINSDISFNKQIDGGLGLGFQLTQDVQLAGFVDIIRARQMRDYVLSSYENKPIPKGTEFYTALDKTDNTLFYNKTFVGASFKIIIALNPRKESEED